MKIVEIRIKNFRSIREETLTFPENGLVALIGPNNAGKSNFLRAIDFLLGDAWSMEGKLEDYDFYGGNRDNEIFIEILFNDRELEKILFCKDEGKNEYKLKYKYRNNEKLYFLSNEIKDRFPCTYLSAERTIAKHLSISKWSLMGKVAKSFNSLLSEDKKQNLTQLFESVKTVFNEVDEFRNFENDFKDCFEEMQSDSPYRLKINFKPFTPNNYFKTINVLASDSNLANDLDIEELGDGAKNLTILALLRSYAKNFRNACGILAIEEPEIFLHPQARRHLFQVLKEISQTNIQIIYTTHDSSFLEFSEFESIRKTFKVDEPGEKNRQETKIKRLTSEELISFAKETGVTINVTKENLSEFYRSLSNLRLTEAFFSRVVILVEGPTEELALPIYLKNCGIDCDKLGVSVLSVGGKSQLAKYWRLFYKFEIPMIILFDGDKTKESNSLVSTCFNENIDALLLSSDIYRHVVFEKQGVFRQDAIIFKDDFESSLKNDAKNNKIDISVFEKDAKGYVVDTEGKPKQVLARWIALQLQEKYSAYKPSFVVKMSELISEILGKSEAKEDSQGNNIEEPTADLPF